MINLYCFGLSEKFIFEICAETEKMLRQNRSEANVDFIRISDVDEELVTPSLLIIKPESFLGEISGIVYAEEKRKEFPQCEIIFLSANYMYLPEIVCRGVKPSGYFILPIRDERFYEIILNRINCKEEIKKVIITCEHKKEVIPYDEILYFTAVNKKIECRTEDGKIFSFYDTMSALETRLGNNFLRCHSGFLVNKRKINGYHKNISFIRLIGCEDSIPVSRKYKNVVSTILTNSDNIR